MMIYSFISFEYILNEDLRLLFLIINSFGFAFKISVQLSSIPLFFEYGLTKQWLVPWMDQILITFIWIFFKNIIECDIRFCLNIF